MEEWSKDKDLITPNNLIRKFGIPIYTSIAACLDFLDEYEGPAKSNNDTIKVYFLNN